MSKSNRDETRSQDRGRRSTRHQKAIENARFMLFLGVVAGTVFGLLIGIKFNIGKRRPPAVDNRASTATTPRPERTTSGPTGASGVRNPVSTDAKNIRFADFDSPGTMSAPNPLLGLWTGWPSDQAVKLGFFEEGICNVYNPVAKDFNFNIEGVLLTTVNYRFVDQPDPATWIPTTENGSRFEWPPFEIVSRFSYTDRDGTEATEEQTHKILCAAELKGGDTPEDKDDFIVYEIKFYNTFFRLEENLPPHSTPMSRQWTRTVETNLRENPNPFVISKG